MKSSLPIEKLDKHNYASWSYKMHWYLLGHGYSSYVEGVNEIALELSQKEFPAWEQGTSRVLYCLVFSMYEQMIDYIRDVKTSKQAWEI